MGAGMSTLSVAPAATDLARSWLRTAKSGALPRSGFVGEQQTRLAWHLFVGDDGDGERRAGGSDSSLNARILRYPATRASPLNLSQSESGVTTALPFKIKPLEQLRIFGGQNHYGDMVQMRGLARGLDRNVRSRHDQRSITGIQGQVSRHRRQPAIHHFGQSENNRDRRPAPSRPRGIWKR